MKKMKSKSTKSLIDREIVRLETKYGSVSSLHEGYSLLLEEMDEFWEEVKKKPSKRNIRNIKHELTQISALSRFMLEKI